MDGVDASDRRRRRFAFSRRFGLQLMATGGGSGLWRGDHAGPFMRHVTWLVLCGVLLLGGCAWVSYKLLAPPGSSFAVRLRDMRECHFEATRAVMSGEPRLRAQTKVPLKGRSTQRFIDDGAPVVDHRGNPAPWKSLLASYGSSEVSDRYILCLLGAGYHWEDGATQLGSE